MLVFIEHLADRHALRGTGYSPNNTVPKGHNVVPERLAMVPEGPVSTGDRKAHDYGAFCSAMQSAATEEKWGR